MLGPTDDKSLWKIGVVAGVVTVTGVRQGSQGPGPQA